MPRTLSRIAIVFVVAIALVSLNSLRLSNAQDDPATAVGKVPATVAKPVADSDRRVQLDKKKKEFFPELSAAQIKIESALNDPTSIEFVDTPLNDAVQFLAEFHHIPMLLDKTALEDSDITLDTPLTASLKDVSLRSTLNVILSPLGLTYESRNEVLYITSRDATFENRINRVYPVGDLVTADEKSFDQLTQAIQETTDTMWLEVDGEGGSISVVSANSLISILQTYHGHEAVLQFLRSMREAREAQGARPMPAPIPAPIPPTAVNNGPTFGDVFRQPNPAPTNSAPSQPRPAEAFDVPQ